MIAKVVVSKNRAGSGWFVHIVSENRQETAVGGSFSGGPIMEATTVIAVAAKWTSRMLLQADDA